MLPMFSIEECDGDSKGKILSTEKSQTLSSHFSQYSDANEYFKNHGTELQKQHANTTNKDVTITMSENTNLSRQIQGFSEISLNEQNYKLQKHLTIRRNQIQQIKVLNKDQEQMASFKYLRTLGSHLKSVVKSPGLFQKFDKIKKVTQDIVLTKYAGQNSSQLKLMPYESDYLKMLDGYKNDQNQEYSDKISEDDQMIINEYQTKIINNSYPNSMKDLNINQYKKSDELDNIQKINVKPKNHSFSSKQVNMQQRQAENQKGLTYEQAEDYGYLTECIEESQSVSQTDTKFAISKQTKNINSSNKYMGDLAEDNQDIGLSDDSKSVSVQSQSYCNEIIQIKSESDQSNTLQQSTHDTKQVTNPFRMNLIRHSSIIPYEINKISERQMEESLQSSSIRGAPSSKISNTKKNGHFNSEESDFVQKESSLSIGTDSISAQRTGQKNEHNGKSKFAPLWLVISNSEHSIEGRSYVSSSSPSPILSSNQLFNQSKTKNQTIENEQIEVKDQQNEKLINMVSLTQKKKTLQKIIVKNNCDRGTSPLTQLTSQSAEEISHSSSIASLQSEKESQISEYKKEYYSQMHDQISSQFIPQQNIENEVIKVQAVENLDINRMDRFKTKTQLQINTVKKQQSRMKQTNKLSSTRNVNMTGSFSNDSHPNMQLSLTQKINKHMIQKIPSIYGSSQDKNTIFYNGQNEQQLLVNDNSTNVIGSKYVYEEEKIPFEEQKVEDVSPIYNNQNQNLVLSFNPNIMQQNLDKFDTMIMQNNNLNGNKQQFHNQRKDNSSKTIIDSQNNQQQYIKQLKNTDSLKIQNDISTLTPKSETLTDIRSPENRVFSQRDKIKPVLWKLFQTQQEHDINIRKNQTMSNMQKQVNQNPQSRQVQHPQIMREKINQNGIDFNNLIRVSSSQLTEHMGTEEASIYTKSPLNKDHLFTENDFSENNMTQQIQQMRIETQEQENQIESQINAEQDNQFINNIMYNTASVVPASNNQNTHVTSDSFNQQIQMDHLNHLQTYQTHHSIGDGNRMEFQYEEEKYSNQQSQARFFHVPNNSVYDNAGSSPSWSRNPNSVAQQNQTQVPESKKNNVSPQTQLLSSFNSIQMLHKTNESKQSQSRQRSKPEYQNLSIQQNDQNVVIFDKDKFSSHLQDENQSRNIQSLTAQQKSYPINKKQFTQPLDQINQYSSMNSQQYPHITNITQQKFRTEQNTQQNSPRMMPKSVHSQKQKKKSQNKGQHLKQNFLNDLRKNLEMLDVHIDNDANSTYEKYLQYGQVNNNQPHYMQQHMTVPNTTPLSPLNPLSDISQPFTRIQHLRNVISSRGSSLSPLSNSNQNFNSFQNTNQFVTRQNSITEENNEEVKEIISNNNKINYNPLLTILKGQSQGMKRGITKYEQEFNKQITFQSMKSRSRSNGRHQSQGQQNSSNWKWSMPISPTVSQERDDSMIRIGQMNLTPNKEYSNQPIQLSNMNKQPKNQTIVNIRDEINKYQNIDKNDDLQNPNMKTEPQLYEMLQSYPDCDNEKQLQETFAQSQMENENQHQNIKQQNKQYVQRVNQDISKIQSREQRKQKEQNIRGQLENGSQQINFNMTQQLNQYSRNDSQAKKFRTQIQTPTSGFDYQLAHQQIQTAKNQDLKYKKLNHPYQRNDQQIYNNTPASNQRPRVLSNDQLYEQNQQHYPLIRQMHQSSIPNNLSHNTISRSNNLQSQRMQGDISNTTQQLYPANSTEYYRDMQSNNLDFGPQFQTYHVKPKNEQQFIQRDLNNNVLSQDQQYMIRPQNNQVQNSALRSYPSSNNYRYTNPPPICFTKYKLTGHLQIHVHPYNSYNQPPNNYSQN